MRKQCRRVSSNIKASLLLTRQANNGGGTNFDHEQAMQPWPKGAYKKGTELGLYSENGACRAGVVVAKTESLLSSYDENGAQRLAIKDGPSAFESLLHTVDSTGRGPCVPTVAIRKRVPTTVVFLPKTPRSRRPSAPRPCV